MTLRKWLGQSNQRTGTNCCIKTRQWHLYLTHCHIHTETWVQIKLSITLAHFHNAHAGSVILCLYTNTNITHFALRTLAHTPITHTQKAVSKLTLAFLFESDKEKKEREREKQYSREGKWGCHQKTKKTKRRKRTRQEELGRTVISKKHMWERARENDVPDKKNRKRDSQKAKLCFEGFIKREMKADTQQRLWIINDRGSRRVRI